MSKKPNYAAQFDEQADDESDDFKRVFGGVKVPKGLQPGSTELTALEWVHKSPTSLTIDTELTQDEWFLLIESIETIQKRYQWYLGDCMVYGVRREYGATDDQIQRIMDITGKGKSTLNEYYKTALLFEIHERSYNLEFEQHRILAVTFSEDTPEQKETRLAWLKIAEEQKLSGRKLMAEIAKAQLPASADDPELPDGVTLERVDLTPLPDEMEEEATDLPRQDLPLDDDENWKAIARIQDVVKRRTYNNLTPVQRTHLQRQIDIARQALSLLEVELRRKPPASGTAG